MSNLAKYMDQKRLLNPKFNNMKKWLLQLQVKYKMKWEKEILSTKIVITKYFILVLFWELLQNWQKYLMANLS